MPTCKSHFEKNDPILDDWNGLVVMVWFDCVSSFAQVCDKSGQWEKTFSILLEAVAGSGKCKRSTSDGVGF
jgi:hypothetical protein